MPRINPSNHALCLSGKELLLLCYDSRMSSWAGRRKLLYSATTISVLLLVIGAVSYAWLSRPASCLDGKKNGNEEQIDCGGSCARICQGGAQAPVLLWTRSFEVAPGVYNAAAYVENRNGAAYARNVKYSFRLFDDRNVLIAERVGMATIAPTRFVPIVETAIATGNRVPARAFFEFQDAPMWERGTAPSVEYERQIFDEGGRKLSVDVRNTSSRDLTNVPVAAILYDAQGTAQTASVSLVPRIGKGKSEQVVFTWPLPFTAPIVEAQIVALPLP